MCLMCVYGVYMCSMCVYYVCIVCVCSVSCGEGSWISTSRLMVEPALSFVSLALGVQTLGEKMFLQAKSEQKWMWVMKGREDFGSGV